MTDTQMLRRSRVGRAVALAVAAALLAFVPQLLMPRPAAACSCMARQPLTQYVDDGSVILAGTVIGRDALGVQVAVKQWFAGDHPSPLLRITGNFGVDSVCGVGSEPPGGSSWIWVAWRPEGEDGVQISSCAPTGDLATPEGQALLAEAQSTFGGGPAIPDPSPAASAPSDSPTAGPAAVDLGVAGMALGGIAVGALLLGGVAVLARRRGPGSSPG